MVDITHKISTLRVATATAIVKVSRQETVDAVVNNLVPKGNVFEMAKTAGLFAVKIRIYRFQIVIRFLLNTQPLNTILKV